MENARLLQIKGTGANSSFNSTPRSWRPVSGAPSPAPAVHKPKKPEGASSWGPSTCQKCHSRQAHAQKAAAKDKGSGGGGKKEGEEGGQAQRPQAAWPPLHSPPPCAAEAAVPGRFLKQLPAYPHWLSPLAKAIAMVTVSHPVANGLAAVGPLPLPTSGLTISL
ncbi:Hypothetical predicted protein [Marmota monax]|uniref:Uncharacterized protein n=1 Tax=Marmota monax TaxID=9995 RepID=A0A5E4D129_MARMO|nr:Hypothetical predicted protein [Marmota monax]